MPESNHSDRDKALLALVIEEAGKVNSDSNYFVGRTALQKTIYFIKAINVPLDYEFIMTILGPSCVQVQRDGEWLQAYEMASDVSESPFDYSDYIAGSQYEEFLNEYPEVKQYREQVKRIVTVKIPISRTDGFDEHFGLLL